MEVNPYILISFMILGFFTESARWSLFSHKCFSKCSISFIITCVFRHL